MANELAWPAGLAPRSVMLRPVNAAVLGPVSLSGRQQTLESGAGFWELQISSMPVGGPVDVATYRAFLTSMRGGARGAFVPIFDYDQAPWPNAGSLSGNTNAAKKFSTGFQFSTGYGFYNPAIKVYLNGAHSELATSITVTITAAGTIRPGQRFSFVNGSVHEIQSKTSTTVWEIWPPLRRDYPASSALEFGRPKLKAMLVSAGEGALSLRYGRNGDADLTFRELI